MAITLTQSGIEHKVSQYPMPIKGTPVALSINGQAVEGKVTNARGKVYTYFAVAGGEFYVAGELNADPATLALPEGFAPRELKSRSAAYDEVKAKRAEKIAAGEIPAPKPRGRKKAAASDTEAQAKAAEQWGGNQAAA